MSNEISIRKRNNRFEPLDYNKIHKVLFWATGGLKQVSVSDIEINAHLKLYDGITTNEIHEVLIDSAAGMITERFPNYQYVAARLLMFYIRKNIFGVCRKLPHLKKVIKKNIKKGVYDSILLERYTDDEIDLLNDFIKHERDFDLSYAGARQMTDKYLLKDRATGELHETPQYMYMLIAMTLFSNYNSHTRLQYVRKFYNAISTWKISLPTPIICGVRTPIRQYSSCVLQDVDDTIDSIYSSNTAVGYYTSKRAGIGLNLGRIRAIGSSIRKGEVVHTGLIPFLKMYEATVKSCTQNGVRGGSANVNYPFWHAEVQSLIVLKNNKGTENNRVRHLDYTVQLCRLFYKRVKTDGDLALFSPHDVPDLFEAFGYDNDKFEKLYAKYEKTNKVKGFVKARQLFAQICKERLETGRIYLMNLDHVNNHSSFKDKVYQTNLCCEVTLPTTPIQHIDDENGETGICTLSAINMGKTSIEELPEVCDLIIRALDFVIDEQEYPVLSAEHMRKRRSLGIGITNLAYYLAKNNARYTSRDAVNLVDEYFEHMQYNCLVASNNLAKEIGPCEYFSRTKYADGILPIDTYAKTVDEICKRELSCDWETLRKDIKKHGLRNSCLTAQMPCESSSVVSNSTNGIEPPRALVSVKKSKKGKLKQAVPELRNLLRQYTTAYEMIDNKGYLRICAVMQKYMDQAISVNNYYVPMMYEERNIPLSVIMDDILYHYWLGGKTMYYANTYDGKADVDEEQGCAGGACSV